MTADNFRLDQATIELHEAIMDNGGVECEQVPDVFFPEEWAARGASQSTNMYNLAIQTARQICMRCPVMDKCLRVGMAEDYGIWGGTTPKQRRQLKREQEL
jgi:hypothetical protein